MGCPKVRKRSEPAEREQAAREGAVADGVCGRAGEGGSARDYVFRAERPDTMPDPCFMSEANEASKPRKEGSAGEANRKAQSYKRLKVADCLRLRLVNLPSGARSKPDIEATRSRNGRTNGASTRKAGRGGGDPPRRGRGGRQAPRPPEKPKSPPRDFKSALFRPKGCAGFPRADGFWGGCPSAGGWASGRRVRAIV